jgi:hypothetical protein
MDYLNPSIKYLYQGKSYTRDQLIAAGWTEEQIRNQTTEDDVPF